MKPPHPQGGEMELNPYAAPADVATVTEIGTGVFYFRDGDFLAVRDGAVLPEVCVVHNVPPGPGSWRKQVKIAWSPPWVFATVLINIIVLAIVVMIFQKKGKITYTLGTAARARQVRRRALGFVMLAVSIGFFVAAFTWIDSSDVTGICFVGGFLTLIGSLIPFIIANPVKPVKFKNGWFRIKGCSKDFLATLPEYPSPF